MLHRLVALSRFAKGMPKVSGETECLGAAAGVAKTAIFNSRSAGAERGRGVKRRQPQVLPAVLWLGQSTARALPGLGA